MKKLLRLSLFISLFGYLTACVNSPNLAKLDNSSATESRRLLVTFTDRSVTRRIRGYGLDYYPIQQEYANSAWSEGVAEALARRRHLILISQWPISELGISCVVYEIPESLSLQQVLHDLQEEREISSVQRMNGFDVLGEPTASSSQHTDDPYLQLQSGYKSLGIEDLHQISTGRGVRIALIDTGVDLMHPDIRGQIRYSENLAPQSVTDNPGEIHGTAVAGILSARPNNGIGIAGIAPEAEVLAFRACWPLNPGSLAAHCNSLTLALALNQAIRMNSRIINLSLSGPEDNLLRLLVEKALANGIIVIAASPGKGQSGGFPANVSGVIAVGQGGGDFPSSIIAPGQDILTTVPNQAYEFMTGSSFATPHVAGLTALILQIHPSWQRIDVMRLLGKQLNRLSVNQLEIGTSYAEQNLKP